MFFETVTDGTTPLVGNVKRYLTVGSTETLLATEDVEYDSCGNITKYGDTTFVYDKLNRLVRENNKTIDKTIVWEYDVSGNVTSRREYAYTEGAVGTQTGSCSFGYNHATHKDWLTSFVGIPITYDAMGNPTSYKGTTFGWSRGRLLTSATQGSKSISMGYNIDGVRCNKTVITGSGVVSTSYHYEGANLMHEVVTKNGTTTNRKYLYNSQGIVGFIQNDVEYIYHKNIFGDVVAIYQGATKVAEYAYDAYGRNFIKVDIDGIATSNPFRYRGYYWDSDLSLYYLMSRYYDPATSRFINTDSLEYLDPESIHGLNLFAYCGNNPVMYADPSGNEWYNPFTWNWREIIKGLEFIMIGVSAVCVGVITLPYGGWISVVAGLTILAGGVTILFGGSDVYEGITNYNFIQETVFAGNEEAYNITENIFALSAIVGSIICGIYVSMHTTTTKRSLPGSKQKPHSGIWNINDKTLGYYGADGQLKYSIAFTDHNSPEVHSIPHWHTEMPHSVPYNNFWRFIIEIIKKLLKK